MAAGLAAVWNSKQRRAVFFSEAFLNRARRRNGRSPGRCPIARTRSQTSTATRRGLPPANRCCRSHKLFGGRRRLSPARSTRRSSFERREIPAADRNVRFQKKSIRAASAQIQQRAGTERLRAQITARHRRRREHGIQARRRTAAPAYSSTRSFFTAPTRKSCRGAPFDWPNAR